MLNLVLSTDEVVRLYKALNNMEVNLIKSGVNPASDADFVNLRAKVLELRDRSIQEG